MTTETTPADPDHQHYDWGASNAKTWRQCPGSINFSRAKKEAGVIPEDTSTKYADEGTVAHDWADKYLKGEISREEIPPNIYESLEGYLDLAEQLKEERPDAEVFTEQKVPLFYNLNEVGTLDFSVADPLMVEILDYKNGFQPVDPELNDQECIYARSLMLKLEEEGWEFSDDTIVRMWIFQPNELAFDGEGKMWETTYRDLQDICIDIHQDYKDSRDAEVTDLNPSNEACMFCDARAICTKRVVEMFENVPDEANMLVPSSRPDNVINLPAIDSLDDAARAAIFHNHKAIAKWMNDVNDNSLALIEQGTLIDGLKTVDGKKGNRGWGDNELEAEKLLRKLPVAKRYKPRRVLSPAQADKALKAHQKELEAEDPDAKPIRTTRFNNRFEELIYRKPGKPVLAAADDPRPARETLMDKFEDEPDTGDDAIEVETEVVTEEDCF